LSNSPEVPYSGSGLNLKCRTFLPIRKTMTISSLMKLPCTAALFLPALFAQTGSLGMGVNSTYGLGNSTFNSVQYAITIGIEYNSGLTAASYISPAQLTTAYQGFLNAYPNPGDPPEAILLWVAQSFAQQYSQFNLITLDATAAPAASATAGSATAPQAEIEASASNLQVGALDRPGPKPHKAAKP
jgi:hypothetical protein